MGIYAGILHPRGITQCPSQAGGIWLGSMAKMGISPHFPPFPGEKKLSFAAPQLWDPVADPGLEFIP